MLELPIRERDQLQNLEAWALALRSTIGHRRFLNEIGAFYLQQGKWEQAEEILQTTLERARQEDRQKYIAHALAGLAPVRGPVGWSLRQRSMVKRAWSFSSTLALSVQPKESGSG